MSPGIAALEVYAAWVKYARDGRMLNRFFGLDSHGTTVRTEVLAGFTTFLTMAYIVVVNPIILGAAGTLRQHLTMQRLGQKAHFPTLQSGKLILAEVLAAR